MKFDIKNIFSHFDVSGEFAAAEEIHSGHINDTFLVKTSEKPFFILQRINHFVFTDVPRLMNNKVSISRHLTKKLGHVSEDELHKRVLTFANAETGDDFYRDDAGNYWNLMYYVDDCVNYSRVPDKNIAFEAGKIFGEFLSLTRDFDSSRLYEVIPNFHTMSFRFEQFDEALEKASAERKDLAAEQTAFAKERRDEMHTIENLVKEKKIPLRVSHNDTKISNVLFSQNGEALCVIDTDTVMEGVIHFDFGDAVRIICNTANEDEKDISLVNFNMPFYECFTKGFVGALRNEVSQTEIDHLAFSAKMMTFIIGLRFLTDFLNEDIYFKTSYKAHNLDRAKNQFKLVNEMNKNLEMMNEIAQKEFRLCRTV